MSTGKKTVPEIRFGGFSEPWAQRKLGDMGSTFTGLSGKTKEDFGHGDAKFITYMNVYTNAVADLTMTEPIEVDSKQNKVKAGDVFFTTSSETPEEVGMSCVMPADMEDTYLNSFCFGYRQTERLDLNYLAYALRSNSFREQMVFLAQGISRYNISKNKVMEAEIAVPSSDEQSQIGSIFESLDSLISQHQHKYDTLVAVKKAMLEKMFPREGETVPQIRFAGFADPWEQRKLGDIVERVVRKNTNNESSLPLTISAQYGLVDQITYFNNRVASRDVSNYYLVLNGEFAYNKSTSDGFPFGAVKRLDLYEKGVLSTLYIVFSIKNQSEIDSDYLTVFFDTDRWHKGVSERAAEGARNHGLLNISADDFFDIDIFLPRHKEEQVAIGSYLRHLDNLITLHQRKCEVLKNLKSALLSKMFVGTTE